MDKYRQLSSNSEPMSRVGLLTMLDNDAFTQMFAGAQEELGIIVGNLPPPTADETIGVEDAIEKSNENIDDSIEAMQDGTDAINAMNDTRLLIAPHITEPREKDIRLIQQVAETSAAGMGIDPTHMVEKLTKGTADGMSLNMEGFDKTAMEAMRALWRYMDELYGYTIDLTERCYHRFTCALKTMQASLVKIHQLPEYSTADVSWCQVPTSWRNLHIRGDVVKSGQDLKDTAVNIMRVLLVVHEWHVGTDAALMTLLKAPTAEDLQETTQKGWEQFLDAVSKGIGDGNFTVVDCDAEGLAQVGNNRLKVYNLGDERGHQLGAAWEAIPYPPEGTYPMLEKADLVSGVDDLADAVFSVLVKLREDKFLRCLKESKADLGESLIAFENVVADIGQDAAQCDWLMRRCAMARNALSFNAIAYARYLNTVCGVTEGVSDYMEAYLAMGKESE